MADDIKETSTTNYTMGYADALQEHLRRRTAATNAAYLLPHLRPGMRVLGVGCGPGTISVDLAAAVAPGEFYGVDMEESQVKLAAAAAREGGHSNARFRVADALDLPFPDGHFDVVHCHAFLNHIPDTMAALAEIKRVLKTGGILGAREIILDSSFIEPGIGNLNRGIAMVSALMVANGSHPQVSRELRARFSEAGFVDIEATGSFDSSGSPSDITFSTGFLIDYVFGPPLADPAIARGIATREEFDEWRETVVAWKDHPGAFFAEAWGEAIGHKP